MAKRCMIMSACSSNVYNPPYIFCGYYCCMHSSPVFRFLWHMQSFLNPLKCFLLMFTISHLAPFVIWEHIQIPFPPLVVNVACLTARQPEWLERWVTVQCCRMYSTWPGVEAPAQGKALYNFMSARARANVPGMRHMRGRFWFRIVNGVL